MTSSEENILLQACRILFPSNSITRDFLGYIQPDGLKNAYRNRALEHHPDIAGQDGDKEKVARRFRETVEAYKLLDNWLKARKKPAFHLRQRTGEDRPLFTPPFEIAERSADETYYDGELPEIQLKTGLFLYYRGTASYQAVVRAMLWQREMRPQLGEYAKRWGWLNEQDIGLILRATDIVGTFGERAVELGLLSRSQLNILLLQQRRSQKPIGHYFVMKALVSEYILRRHLKELDEHNRRVSENRPPSPSLLTPP